MHQIYSSMSQRVLSHSVRVLVGRPRVSLTHVPCAAALTAYHTTIAHYSTTSSSSSSGTSSSSSSSSSRPGEGGSVAAVGTTATACQAHAKPAAKTRLRSGKRPVKRDKADNKEQSRANLSECAQATVLYSTTTTMPSAEATTHSAWRRTAGAAKSTRRAPRLYAAEDTAVQALQQYATTASIEGGQEQQQQQQRRRRAQSASVTQDNGTMRSEAELRSHASLRGVLDRLLQLAGSFADRVTRYVAVSSDRTLRQLELQLDMAIATNTCDAYTALATAMEERYTDAVYGGRHSVDFLQLYARVLVNYGAYCLVNFAGQRAAVLLRRAMQLMHDSVDQQQQQQQRLSRDGATTKGKEDEAVACDALPAETMLIYIRLLLANALATEQQHWQAAEQYQLALQTLQLYPHVALPQLCPGPVAWQRVSEAFVLEDEAQFMRDAGRVGQAIAQGKAQLLLLQSQGSHEGTQRRRVLEVQLSLARLLRSARQHKASQEWYERYLDALVARNEEDTQGVMLELGRMLCFEMSESETGLVYLDSAAELLREEAEEGLKAVEVSRRQQALLDNASHMISDVSLRARVEEVPRRVTCAAVRAASVMLDTALALYAMDRPGRALTLMTNTVALLDRAGLSAIAAWAMVQHANMLGSVSFVDRAIELYLRAMKVLRSGEAHSGATTAMAVRTHRGTAHAATARTAVLDPALVFPRQLAAMQRMIVYSSLEAEARLAHCLHLYVGDYRRALFHYQHVLESMALLTHSEGPYTAVAPRTMTNVTTVSGRRGGQSVQETMIGGAALSGRGRLGPDVVHWVLEQYVACCERLQRWPAAIAAQGRIIELEAAVGANHIASYLKLIDLTRRNGDLERQLALYFFLFFLPDDLLDAETRLHVAHGFAKCCYMLDNHRMGAVLLHAVQRVRGDYDPGVLVDYALCLKSLNVDDRLHLDELVDELQTGVAAIGRVFRRAASLIVAHRVIDAADDAAMGSENSANSVSRVDRELSSLITLSRGAFFFHQNGIATEAEELYKTALSFAEAAKITGNEDYTHELGILLTNYATLKVNEDAVLAQSLYERAATLCPDKLDVAEVVADYYVQSGNYSKGSVYMRHVIAAKPAAARQMHVQLARLGTSAAVWDGLSCAARLEVLEHLLHGLGIAAARLPRYTSATTEGNFAERLTALEPLFIDGVATTAHGEVACLTNYVLQTRLQRPRLLNQLYKHALRRFPFDTAVLVNYATFCADHGFTTLARKYYAKAYGLTNGDFSRTQCYANCLSSYFDEQQVVCGEVLYRDYLTRHAFAAMAHTHYANYLAVTMPSPFVVEAHFEKALRLDPKSSHTHQLYAHFVWACADSRAAYESTELQAQVFDRAEQLMRAAVTLDPQNVALLLHLGTLYANRRNRFQDAMETLYKAHKLSPRNVEVVRQMCAVLLCECGRVQEAEQRKLRSAAKLGGQGVEMSAQLRELVSSTKRSFECAVQLDPDHRATLEQYANFSVRFLRDHALAAELFRRIQRLGRHD